MMNNLGYSTIQCDVNTVVEVLPPAISPRREANYNIEDPVFPLDDPSVFAEGSRSSSGERVTAAKILSVPAALQAVERISGDIARCPLELWKKNGKVWECQESDPLYRLTAIQPNREHDAFTFWQQVIAHRLIYRNAYIFIAYNPSGVPAELFPMLPDRTEPKREKGELVYETKVDGDKVTVHHSRVIHLRGVMLDNLKALELSRVLRDAFGLALAQTKFAGRVMRSGGRRGGVLELPVAMPKAAQDRVEEGFRRKYEEEQNWFTTVVLRDNAKFHEAQSTLRDSQLVESRKESNRDAARAFNTRPGTVGEGDDGVYGNKYEDARDYVDNTLKPLMTGVCSQARVKLLPFHRQASEQFEHNTDDLLQMSPKEQFEAYGAGVENTIITANEARGILGFEPHPDGNQLRSPHTQSSKVGKPKTGTKRDAGGEGEEEDFGQLRERFDALVESNLADVRRVIGEQAMRVSADPAKFITWLDEKLPAKRANFARAGLEADEANREFESLHAGLQEIASKTPAAGLQAAVANYFRQNENPTHD